MSRGTWAAAFYPAADLFVERSLRECASFVTGESSVWTAEAADDFYERFVVNEELGGGNFSEKLTKQLSGARRNTALLAADLVCLCTLPVHDMGADAKLTRLRAVLAPLSPEPEIDDRIITAFGTGIASYGAGKAVVWKYMRYLAEFARSWIGLNQSSRAELLDDPWKWKTFLAAIPGSPNAQALALLHIVFPGVFEPIVSTDMKAAIGKSFDGVAGVADEPDVDKKLRAIRAALEPLLGGDLHFWDKAIEPVWHGKPEGRAMEFAHFAIEFRKLPDFDKDEVGYKLELSSRLTAARTAVLANEADWLERLKHAFASPNNITSWRQHDTFLKWCEASPGDGLAALSSLWSAATSDEADLSTFLEAVPETAVAGPGARANVVSYLLGAWGPNDWVNYKATASERALTLCGIEQAETGDIAGRITRFRSFIDQLRVRVIALGGPAVTRLEAQGMAWSVVSDYVPDDWSTEDKNALTALRGGPTPVQGAEPTPAGTEPFAAWFLRGYAFPDGSRVEAKWLDEGFVGVGWFDAGPIEAGTTLDEVRTRVKAAFPEDPPGKWTTSSRGLYAFITTMNVGDLVVTTRGSSVFVGRVTGDLTWEPDEHPLTWVARRRTVEWLNREAPAVLEDLSPSLRGSLKVPLTISKIAAADEVAALVGLATRHEPATVLLAPATQDVASRVFFDVAPLQEVIGLLAEKRQLVFFGPPGTGKTLVAQVLAEHLTASGGEWQLVQFHPSYAYEDFMEGYRPTVSDDGSVSYELREGPFRRIVDAALDDPANPYILVVDEINRGNIPKIFGELLFLLEYRDRPIALQYSEQLFSLPPNVFVIGTMNTADRSIALVDAALRRRFYFVPFLPSEAPVKDVLSRWLAKHERDDLPARLLAVLNQKIAKDEVAIGPSYLMAGDGTDASLKRIWRYAILPLLEEHYYGTKHDVEKEFGLAACLAALAPTGASADSAEGDGASPQPSGAEQPAPA